MYLGLHDPTNFLFEMKLKSDFLGGFIFTRIVVYFNEHFSRSFSKIHN